MEGTRPCPHCHEPILLAAKLCRFCRNEVERATLHVEWERPREERQVAGVAAMLGRALGISPTPIRLVFVFTAVFGGLLGLWCYLLLWVCTPQTGGRSLVAEWLAEAERLLGLRPRPVGAEHVAEAARAPEAGPVGAGPMPGDAPNFRSPYEPEGPEWTRRS